MLLIGLAIFALLWALWFAFLIRYPQRWAGITDTVHTGLARWGLSSKWMKQAEKGVMLKFIVGLRTKARPVKIPDKVGTGCTVKLVEWENKSGGWRGQDIVHPSCRVEYYGNKRVITKMKGPNLSITQEVTSEDKSEPSSDT